MNEFEAVVSSRSGRRLVMSGTPLFVRMGRRAVPVNLTLRHVSHGFGPATSATRVVIGAHLSQGVSVGAAGLRLTPAGHDVAGRLVAAGAVMYPNVARDTDAEVSATARGAELFETLRSPESPESLVYKVNVPHAIPSEGCRAVRL
jgi:hypothetical protein